MPTDAINEPKSFDEEEREQSKKSPKNIATKASKYTIKDVINNHDFYYLYEATHKSSGKKNVKTKDNIKHSFLKKLNYTPGKAITFYDIKEFFEQAVADSYFTRIWHQIYSQSPKTSILDWDKCASRKYDAKKNPTINDLRQLLEGDTDEDLAISGLLSSIIYKIIVGDLDSKLANFSVVKQSDGSYQVCPIDIAMVTTDGSKWNKKSLSELINDNNGDIAKNLTETLIGFGKRNNMADIYSKNNILVAYERDSYKYSAILIDVLKAELSITDSNNTKAFIAIFERLINEVENILNQNSNKIKGAIEKEIEDFSDTTVKINCNEIELSDKNGQKIGVLTSNTDEMKKLYREILNNLNTFFRAKLTELKTAITEIKSELSVEAQKPADIKSTKDDKLKGSASAPQTAQPVNPPSPNLIKATGNLGHRRCFSDSSYPPTSPGSSIAA